MPIKNNENIINNNINIDKINNKKIGENENSSEPEEELLIDSTKIKNNDILTSKDGANKHNLGMGITLTSSDNNIHKSKTENYVNTSLSNDNHQKLSTLSENELLKNIIIDTAKK